MKILPLVIAAIISDGTPLFKWQHINGSSLPVRIYCSQLWPQVTVYTLKFSIAETKTEHQSLLSDWSNGVYMCQARAVLNGTETVFSEPVSFTIRHFGSYER